MTRSEHPHDDAGQDAHAEGYGERDEDRLLEGHARASKLTCTSELSGAGLAAGVLRARRLKQNLNLVNPSVQRNLPPWTIMSFHLIQKRGDLRLPIIDTLDLGQQRHDVRELRRHLLAENATLGFKPAPRVLQCNANYLPRQVTQISRSSPAKRYQLPSAALFRAARRMAASYGSATPLSGPEVTLLRSRSAAS